MFTDKVENMLLKDYVPSSPEACVSAHMIQMLLENPYSFRLVFIHLPADERFFLKHCLLNGLSEKGYDWCSIFASDFTDDLLEAIYKGKIPYNSHKYVEPKILLVDDIHLIGGAVVQSEFYRAILKKRMERRDRVTILFSEVAADELRMILRDDLYHFLKFGIKEESPT